MWSASRKLWYSTKFFREIKSGNGCSLILVWNLRPYRQSFNLGFQGHAGQPVCRLFGNYITNLKSWYPVLLMFSPFVKLQNVAKLFNSWMIEVALCLKENGLLRIRKVWFDDEKCRWRWWSIEARLQRFVAMQVNWRRKKMECIGNNWSNTSQRFWNRLQL